MKFFVSSLLTVLAVLGSLALPACSGASSGLGNSGNCASAPCGNGQTLQTCVPQSGCGSTSYSVNGQSFTCNSCNSQDCVQAAQQAANVCLGSSSSSSGGGSGSGSGSGGGNTTCSAATSCGTGTRTYQQCETVSSITGSCTDVAYKTSDGKSLRCASCTNCNDASKELANYCAGIDPGDGGTGVTSCSAAQACGTTGTTFQECTTVSSSTGMCSGISYRVSNGTQFDCASCGDCSGAVSSLDAFCQGAGPTTTCGSAAACGSLGVTYDLCTTSLNGVCQSMYYSTTDGQTYQCASCGDCTAAGTSVGSYCAGMSQTTSCGTASACGNTGVTYDLCTTSQGGSCVSEYYSTTDGQQYNCNSCSDCSAAVTSLNSYCASLNNVTCGTTTCTTGNLCCTCTGVQQCLSSNSGTYTCASYGCQ